MKTDNNKYLALALLWLVALTLCWPAQAQEAARGTPFFLLSDAAYGSDDSAMVRL